MFQQLDHLLSTSSHFIIWFWQIIFHFEQIRVLFTTPIKVSRLLFTESLKIDNLMLLIAPPSKGNYILMQQIYILH